jgi:hypothetical protein
MEEKSTILDYHGPEPEPEVHIPESSWLGILALGCAALLGFVLAGFGIALIVGIVIYLFG